MDAVVTDPPYELAFMGRKWDSSGVAYDTIVWGEALRVLKPGGHLLAFGGTRTWHRLAVAIEDAGFEVRDSIAWMYGSGFPKSLDVSKAIDKMAGAERVPNGAYTSTACDFIQQGEACPGHGDESSLSSTVIHTLPTAPATPAAQQWQGWGTALKPAFEPIVVARKPLDGTVAENVLRHGTGALNIDGSRIAGLADRPGTTPPSTGDRNAMSGDLPRMDYEPNAKGRWPANVILDESQAAELDRQSGVSVSKSGGVAGWQDEYVGGSYTPIARTGHNDTGGASRFFYVPKANASERPRDGDTAHPTVKPLDLMRYLVKLVTPPGGTVLEPFAGSGATIEAALDEGFHVIGIELTDEYLPLIQQRINRVTEQIEGRLL